MIQDHDSKNCKSRSTVDRPCLTSGQWPQLKRSTAVEPFKSIHRKCSHIMMISLIYLFVIDKRYGHWWWQWSLFYLIAVDIALHPANLWLVMTVGKYVMLRNEIYMLKIRGNIINGLTPNFIAEVQGHRTWKFGTLASFSICAIDRKVSLSNII